ncbi:MAG: glycine--tRNA ligase subunit beta [Thermodesulfobacteriota bacterium]
MSKNFILEIGTEEIPAGFITLALSAVKKRLETLLRERRCNFSAISSLGTPRRLTVIVERLGEEQEDVVTEVMGPSKEKGFDKDGKPTKAAEGFARGQGVAVEELQVVETKKGAYLSYKKMTVGGKTVDLLREITPTLIESIPFPKVMRWGDSEMAFARPIHWILSLYGSEVVPFTVGGVESGSLSRGHRFLKPKPFKITSLKMYRDKLKTANVILDAGERQTLIRDGIEKAAREVGGSCIEDLPLLEEVANLVEYPVVLRGNFDSSFLDIPKVVVVNAMREHQRYFSVIDGDGTLLPHFITVANIEAERPEVIIKGNERVLKARLNDARFYYDRDIGTPLTKRAEALKEVVYQESLGTSYEKMTRFTRLVLSIGSTLGLTKDMEVGERVEDFLSTSAVKGGSDILKDKGCAKAVVGRAAMLAKADLVSDMVGEFPNLQGIMGAIYAERAGELKEVSEAIAEHYLPTSAGGELPSSPWGALISVADKMDTICGCFGVGLLPTGTADPYALRRQALGIIAIIEDKGFSLPLDALVHTALDLLKDKLTRPQDETVLDILDFFKERLRNQLLSRGYPFGVIDAVLSTPSWYDVADAVRRVDALNKFKSHPDCERLVMAFKRVSNILKGQDLADALPDPALFEGEYETGLMGVAESIAPEIERQREAGDYEGLFMTLISIKEQIDTFFDEVMVMVEDEKVRRNRLTLLRYIERLYSRIADMSKITI